MSGDFPLPKSYSFVCQTCDRTQSARRMVENVGRCRHCRGGTWTLEYTVGSNESGRGAAMVAGRLALAAMGVDIPLEHNPDGEQRLTFRDIPAEDVAAACNEGTSKEYIRRLAERCNQQESNAHRERLLKRGGECKQCGAVYVRRQDKEWTLQGYCSNLCRSQDRSWRPRQQLPASLANMASRLNDEPDDLDQPPAHQKIRVDCICGHKFDVPAMYRGTKRACPQCGGKSLVAE